ncbi:carotenoid biosynthesis protein [Methanocella sp. MCL-LM]|uniref:carotenoid biosynthesis protein n=1 Tax=Methanocella sp. MCL-LM TaxID=3412035 RepID=UPI003C73A521
MFGASENSDDKFNRLLYASIIVLSIVTVLLILFNDIKIIDEMQPVIMTIIVFAIVSAHGIKRYGLKNMVIFFFIAWIVSHFFEALSIVTGFPFSYYTYVNMEGPRLFDVPVTIMFAYFSIGYLSWMLAHVITGQYGRQLEGKHVFLVPFIATFIMVMWDLTMDPIASTVHKLWIWTNPGPFYGVPVMNFFGWFLVVFIFFQVFAIYLSKYDIIGTLKTTVFNTRPYWAAVAIVYIIQAAYGVINLRAPPGTSDIFLSMGLIAVFTTMFVTIISLVIISNSKELI